MFNRRNLRVKTLQMLYASAHNESLTHIGALDNIKRNVTESNRLYLYHFLVMAKLALYQLKDNDVKAERLIKDGDDLPINDRLLQNPLLTQMRTEEAFRAACKSNNLNGIIDEDVIKHLYKSLEKTTIFKIYAKCSDEELERYHVELVKKILKKVLNKSERFDSHLEESFLTYYDDDHMVRMAVSAKISSFQRKKSDFTLLPTDVNMTEQVQFAQELFSKTKNMGEEYVEIIEPHLKNWELERVTKLDLFLLQMAICEFLEFPHIPVKVTMNEYIEISKEYSTPKSKDFINGILDRIKDELNTKNLIKKKGRGLLQ